MTLRSGKSGLRRFIFVYSVGNIGAFVCFVPLIGLLLPQRVIQLAPDDSGRVLSLVLFVGALAASVSNIGAGWISDLLVQRCGRRMPLVAVGLVGTMISFVLIACADSVLTLAIAFVAFQLSFNLVFAPMGALAADYIPDAAKGRVFGWLSLGLPAAQVSIIMLTWSPLTTLAGRLTAIAVAALLLLVPLLAAGDSLTERVAEPKSPQSAGHVGDIDARGHRWDFVLAWFSRFFVQCAAVAATSYMFLYLSAVQDLARAGHATEVAFGWLTAISLACSLSVGLIIGFWSDRVGRRRPFLIVTSFLVGLGLLLSALGHNVATLTAGYSIFAVGLTGFLAVDGAMIAQIVGRGGGRAARLGLVNLANTIPSMLVPAVALVIGMATSHLAETIFLCAAGGALLSAVLSSQIKSIR